MSEGIDQDRVPLIDLRIPGPWLSQRDLGQAIEDADTGYYLDVSEANDEMWFVHEESGRRVHLGAAERDDEIGDLFADNPRVTEAEAQAVRNHKVKVFLSGPGGSLDAAREFLAMGAALLKAGGLGVMVDNSGNCHSPQDWRDLASDKAMGGMYWAFVAVTATGGEVFSTGMHCLGFRDAEIPDPTDTRECGMMMHEFLGYSYQSGVTILDGDPIGGPEGPDFILRHVPSTRFDPNTAFHNPYGVWRMEKFVGDENEPD